MLSPVLFRCASSRLVVLSNLWSRLLRVAFFAFLISITQLLCAQPDRRESVNNFSMPEGLVPRLIHPEGLTVESRRDAIDIHYQAQGDDINSVEFYLVVPAELELVAKWDDYTLSLLPPSERQESQDEETVSREAFEAEPERQALMEASRRITFQDEGFLRFWRIVQVRLDLKPVNPEGEKRYYPKMLHFRLPFAGALAAQDPLPEYPEAAQAFRRILSFVVVNPEAAALYASRSKPPASTAPLDYDWTPRNEDRGRWARFDIDQDGFYRIHTGHLQAMGLDPDSIRGTQVRLFSEGKQVPLLTQLPEQALFAEKQLIVFHGKASDSKYTAKRPYYIQVDDKPFENRAKIPMRKLPEPFPANTPGQRTTIDHVRFERDEELLLKTGDFLSIEDYQWVWHDLDPSAALEVPFELHRHYPPSREDIEVEIAFYIEQSIPGRPVFPANGEGLQLRVNDGETISLEPFKDESDIIRHFSFPASLLKPEGNRLLLTFPAGLRPQQINGEIYLDYFIMTHRRFLAPYDGELTVLTEGKTPWRQTAGFDGPDPLAFDITQPDQIESYELQAFPVTPQMPLPIHGFYEARADRKIQLISPLAIPDAPTFTDTQSRDIRNPDLEADYLIIYHDSLKEQALRLADHRTSQGLSVKMVSVDTIYQEFNRGAASPRAIKDFLLHSLRHWKKPPVYVCLFGDATSDYRNELRFDVDNLVPAYTYETKDEKWASELWYANLLGDDLLPDILMGRLAVRNAEDADEVVRKIVEYDNASPLGPWRNRAVYCADHTGFSDAMEKIRTEYRPPSVKAQRIYLEEYPWEDNFYLPREIVKSKRLMVSTAATLDILDTLNRGAALVLYMGHGSPNIWSNERIWFGGESPNSDNLNLRNEGRLPFVVTFTCNQGAFDYPKPPWHICISEDMMRVKDGGAIALYVPSGPGFTSIHEKVAHPLMQALFRDGVRGLGELIGLSRVYFVLDNLHSPQKDPEPGQAIETSVEEILRMYILLGDPALELEMPATSMRPKLQIQPQKATAGDGSGRNILQVEADVADIPVGRFVATISSDADFVTTQTQPIAYSGGKIRWNFIPPVEWQPGNYRVQIYYGNDANKKDDTVYGRFELLRPQAAIERITLADAPQKPGDKAEVKILVKNMTPLEVRNMPLSIAQWDSYSKTMTALTTKTVSLGPSATEVVSLSHPVKYPVTVLECRIPDSFRFVGETDSRQDLAPVKNLLISLSESIEPDQIYLVDPLTLLREHPGRNRQSWQAQITLLLGSRAESLNLDATLLHPSGKTAATKRVSIPAGNRIEQKEIVFDVDLRRLPLPPSYRLQLSRKQNQIEKTLLDREFTLGRKMLPDLRMVTGSFQTIPDKPVEGHTIFFRFLVENRGEAESPPFHINAQSRNEQNNYSMIRSRPLISQWRQAAMYPGEERWVQLRWDNDPWAAVAGDKTLEINLDSMNAISETVESNNKTEHPFHIMSRPDIVIDRDNMVRKVWTKADGTKMARVEAEIRNDGEADGHNYRVGVYTRPPNVNDPKEFRDPELRIKEIEIDRIGGLESITVEHEWQVTDKDATTSPTVHIYKTSKAIRAERPETMQIPEEW
ncbi:MAG: C25 family cysteine peptidase [Candidatus Sumerlaeia bacterium]